MLIVKQEGYLFWNPSKVLWRYLEACEEGRRVCWKELKTLGTSGEEIKEPTKWNKSVSGSQEVRGIQGFLELG